MRIEPVFLFDLDGTLVDSVYQHVLAWKEALDAEGIALSVWRIHRKIGMSGGLFTNQLLRETGLEIDAERVERLRRLHAQTYRRMAAGIRPLPGSRELLDALSSAGIPWAIATSGRMETARVTLEVLGVDPERTAVITRGPLCQARSGPLCRGSGAARRLNQCGGGCWRQHLGHAGRHRVQRAGRRAPQRRLWLRRAAEGRGLPGL
jgi:phosphoglycolate phosphatase-like HAD superfamily hydrolase